MKTLTKKLAAIVWAVFALLVAFDWAIFASNQKTASAASYSDVMDDLNACENFSAADYPANAKDYTLEVIQIAESVNNELFVYVYQPSDGTKELTASSVNISTQEKGESGYTAYNLQLLNSSGVFDKYKVQGFTVNPKDALRYYNISSISRAYDSAIDEPLSAGNTASTVACAVGQAWEAYTYNDKVLYSCEYLDVIKLDSKHVGFIRYQDFKVGIFPPESYTDSHYVAFKTNRSIDSLLEAEISFYYQTYHVVENSLFTNLDVSNVGAKTFVKKKLLASEIFSKESKWWDDYEYNRIQSTMRFLASETEEFKEETLAALEQTDWILRFYESEYYSSAGYTTSADSVLQNYQTVNKYTTVSDVSILSLRYTYAGKIYSLGVVDNAQTGSNAPDNKDWDENEWENIADGLMPDWFTDWLNKMTEAGRKVLVSVVLVVVVVAIIWICSVLFKKHKK